MRPPERPRAPWGARLASLMLAGGTGSVLAVARWLEPSALGHSTHTQLGLSECTFLALTGYPCPMCGATTTFSLLAHARPLEAALNQPFAALLFLVTVGVFAVAAAEVVLPRDRWARLGRLLGPWEGVLSSVFLFTLIVGWLWKILIMA